MKKLILWFSIIFMTSAFSVHHRYTNDSYIDVNMSKSSKEKRLCVIQGRQAIYCTWVTHGLNSGGEYAKYFSNEIGSGMSSLGTYKVGEKYYGAHGLSYRLDGLSKGLNTNVRTRAIVIHESNYIGYGKTGRSLGCLAIAQEVKKELFKFIYSGMIIKVHK